MKITIILAAFIYCFQLAGQVDSTTALQPTERYVFSFSGLNLRAAPSTDAFIRSKLKHGTAVMVLSESIITDTIEHRIGRWILVSVNHKEGYLFEGFLSNHMPPTIEYAFEACEGINYFNNWIQDHLNDSPIIHEDYEVHNNEANDINCKELFSTINSASEKYSEIRSADFKYISFESDQINLNEVLNFMDYLAASVNKHCKGNETNPYPIIVPYRNKEGGLYKLRYSHVHTITAQEEAGHVNVEMKINV